MKDLYSNPYELILKGKVNLKIQKKVDTFQIDTLAKLFNCEYEDVIDAVRQSNGTFAQVYCTVNKRERIKPCR